MRRIILICKTPGTLKKWGNCLEVLQIQDSVGSITILSTSLMNDKDVAVFAMSEFEKLRKDNDDVLLVDENIHLPKLYPHVQLGNKKTIGELKAEIMAVKY